MLSQTPPSVSQFILDCTSFLQKCIKDCRVCQQGHLLLIIKSCCCSWKGRHLRATFRILDTGPLTGFVSRSERVIDSLTMSDSQKIIKCICIIFLEFIAVWFLKTESGEKFRFPYYLITECAESWNTTAVHTLQICVFSVFISEDSFSNGQHFIEIHSFQCLEKKRKHAVLSPKWAIYITPRLMEDHWRGRR